MTNVTIEQARTRYTTIPPVLQDAVFSVQNAEIISMVAEKYNIPEEKIGDIAEAVGWVLLGFIHPEELAGEIAARTGIAQQVAKDISDSLINRIFNPLRDLLDRVYAPLPHEHEIPEPLRLVEEIKAMPAPPLPTPLPSQISEKNLGGQAGPAAPSSGLVGEFARLKTVEKSPEEGTPLSPAAMEDTAPPTMLHEETPIKSAPQTSSFKIEAPTPKLSDIRAKESEIPRPAIIDFGGSTSFGPAQDKPLTAGGSTGSPQEKPPVPPPLPRTTAPESKPSDTTLGKPFDGAQGKPLDDARGKPPRIVHYTEFRTPLDNTRGKPLDNTPAQRARLASAERRDKPLEKPPEKPSEISGAQAPSNVPLTENKPESSSAPPAPAKSP